MSLNSASIDLNNAMKTVRQAWEDVRQGWDDPIARDFEEHRWEPMQQHVQAVLQAMDRLTPILSKALRDCS